MIILDETTEIFLEKYPDLVDRSPVEIERLKNTSNWMDLSFYTIQPRNNKTFVLNLIPRIVEGRNARYITGSGQTKPTADRVNLFRVEGNCEKIKRPPRRKKEELPTSLSNERVEESMEPRKSVFGSTLPPETNSNNPNLMQFPMLYNAFFTPGMIPYQQLAAYNNAMLKKKKDSSSGMNFSAPNGSSSGPVLSMFQMPSANDEANLAKHGIMLSDGLHYSTLSGENNSENKPLLPSLLDNSDLMKSAPSNSQKEKKNNNIESNNNNKNAKINPLLAGLPSYSPAMLSPSSSAMANNRMPQMPWFSPWGYYPMVDPSMGNHPDTSSQGLPSSANVDPSNINMTLNSLYSNPYAGQIHPALLRNNLASMNANSFNNIIPFTTSNPSNNHQSLGSKLESESKANNNNEVPVAKANKKRKTPSESAQSTAVAPVAPKKTMEPPAKKQMNTVSSQSLNNLVYKTQQPMLRGHTSTSSEGLDLLLAAVGSVENGFELP